MTCSAVDLEPKPFGPAIPAKYLRVPFILRDQRERKRQRQRERICEKIVCS